jgi:phosphate acetyltransferase
LSTLRDRIVTITQQRKRRLILPESDDARVLGAARHMFDAGMCEIILVGEPATVRASADAAGVSIDGFTLLQPSADPQLQELTQQYLMRRPKTSPQAAAGLMLEPVFYAAMLLRNKRADAMVAGAVLPTARVIEAGLFCVGLAPDIKTASSYFAMEFPSGHARSGEVFIFADCAVVIDPSDTQLADIAIASAHSATAVLQTEPHVALLSFSTKGSAKHASIDKIQRALELIKTRAPELSIDGELQVDAALSMLVAQRKVSQQSTVAGRANVLVFPDINAGNIAYKLTQYLGGANAYGPILQGFDRPISDLSRGASEADIIMTAAITLATASD